MRRLRAYATPFLTALAIHAAVAALLFGGKWAQDEGPSRRRAKATPQEIAVRFSDASSDVSRHAGLLSAENTAMPRRSPEPKSESRREPVASTISREQHRAVRQAAGNAHPAVPAERADRLPAAISAGEAGREDPAAPKNDFEPARPTTTIRPSYPLLARRHGWEGVVRISAMVAETGSVSDVRIEQSSGHSTLDDAALAAVREVRFVAATRNNRPVPSFVVLPIRFSLSAQ